eukprot:CAMPEP_0181220858 /NCGR_PEP_ID=MMETSP1096-20121128/29068_1 /TAXON_ID=156174 ORGANISM="Chrysochromulina ericina, Strain CCMP281" /NCGR_SAMPLE_ID=MMETSP1096 /ASSEMBLY_ACC=CAM_ASM_000453 /LENGTH=111 /DNA_ID=CAMNT_0023313403 /DNA_START=73 /DNA_END=413 /DNA_ORIENTATION=-
MAHVNEKQLEPSLIGCAVKGPNQSNEPAAALGDTELVVLHVGPGDSMAQPSNPECITFAPPAAAGCHSRSTLPVVVLRVTVHSRLHPLCSAQIRADVSADSKHALTREGPP